MPLVIEASHGTAFGGGWVPRQRKVAEKANKTGHFRQKNHWFSAGMTLRRRPRPGSRANESVAATEIFSPKSGMKLPA